MYNNLMILAIQFHGAGRQTPEAFFEITIHNQIAEISRVAVGIEAFASEQRLCVKDVRKIQIVLEELLSNIIMYGYDDERSHDIDVKVEVVETALKMTIVDDGVAFNPLDVASPDTNLSLEERSIGGLGILLARTMVDKISYKREEHKNVMTLVKEISMEQSP
jgi:sigma-B regulation protein RsbU (phosphoserine phosphatase)